MSKFTLDVRAFCEKAKKNPETVMRQVSMGLFRTIIKESPVDTGRFKLNWQASGPTPASGIVDGVDKSGAIATGKMVNFVTTTSTWQELTLTNNLPYAQRLEYGWSQQAPTGVVEVNVLRFQQLINEEAAKVR